MMGVMSQETATSETQSAAPKRRRRFRFGLRGLIVMVTLAAIVFAPLGMIARRKQRERHAIELLNQHGADVVVLGPTSELNRQLFGDQWHVYFGPAENEMLMHMAGFGASWSDSRGHLTDAGLHSVVESLSELRVPSISIESSQLTDDGLIGLLDALSIGELQRIDLRCPLVTSRGTDALQQKFPKLVILDD